MYPYIKAAFFSRLNIPGLGAIPLNLLLVFAFFIIGFGELVQYGHAGFWFLGLGLEVSFLYLLANNALFQSYVRSQENDQERLTFEADLAKRRQQLLAKLAEDKRERFYEIAGKVAKIQQLERQNDAKDYVIKANTESLQKLMWAYLKLLSALQTLTDPQHQQKEQNVGQQIADLQADLAEDDLSPQVRNSKEETLEILQKRLATFKRRETNLEHVNSDLARIEAQIELALENASLTGHNALISEDIGMASSFLQEIQEDFYGDMRDDIARLDAYLK